ncbi:MAG: fatty acid desaturase [Acidobacteria bacterium]|nr:fatty acid desaturase [Acidobacteriota bacterium]
MIEAQGSVLAADAPASAPTDFTVSTGREPHAARGREILRNHAGIKALAGRNPWSAPLILGVVSVQTATGWLLRDQPWWVVVIAAFFFGAFLSHTLWVLIHECAHNLIFKSGPWNRVFAIVANLPHLLPSAISFQKYHLKHHAFQGVYELDADIPNRWEAKLIGHSMPAKALWLMFFPIFQVTRPGRLKEIQLFDRWVVLNILVQLAYDAAVFFLLGPMALLFLGVSFFFSVGLHPLGARWIQEHFLVHRGQAATQETSSYYGPLNLVALNVGYHNEHHDFPFVPWNRLPQITKTAPEAYDTLASHRSWTKLLFVFLFRSDVSLFSRTIRAERGGRSMANDPKALVVE